MMVNTKPSYLLIRSKKRKKTLSLQVRRDGSIVIQAPWHSPRAEIDDFFERKQPWIIKRLAERRQQQQSKKSSAFVSGERFLYLGVPYPLEVVAGHGLDEPLNFCGDKFILDGRYVSQGMILFLKWYRARAEAYLTERLSYYGGQIGLPTSELRLSNARRRWGSCSPRNRLFFNWRLLMTPSAVIDYVVVHELMHCREKNHSRNFWRLIAAVIPDYRRHDRWLKAHGALLDFP